VTPELTLETQIDLAIRLTVGLVLGAIIGFERELHRQPAGFRTHSLVALGAALFTVVSAFGFTGDLVDPTRIAAQIVSGIGFIGAGTILQHRGHIRGLTTAASLWAVAAIGTAAGAGLYVVAIVGTLLILIVLAILDRVETMARHHLRLPPEGFDLPGEHEKAHAPDEGRSEDLQ
jgi:putative Mg2+ transporter-C (MgtC) family protein